MNTASITLKSDTANFISTHFCTICWEIAGSLFGSPCNNNNNNRYEGARIGSRLLFFLEICCLYTTILLLLPRSRHIPVFFIVVRRHNTAMQRAILIAVNPCVRLSVCRTLGIILNGLNWSLSTQCNTAADRLYSCWRNAGYGVNAYLTAPVFYVIAPCINGSTRR